MPSNLNFVARIRQAEACRTLTSAVYDAALALVYPQACDVCGSSVESREDGVACHQCWQRTRLFDGSETICWKCGIEATGVVSEEHRGSVRCRRCDDDAYSAARACGTYEGALRASVLALKTRDQIPPRLARLLACAQSRAPLDAAGLIVPVPLHPSRQRERGFNQAAVVGQALAKLCGLPVDATSLVRAVHTERHRAGMDAYSRRESVENAFEVRRRRMIQGERVLLVDDVFTTGATVSACARALREAGAVEVFVLTLARPGFGESKAGSRKDEKR